MQHELRSTSATATVGSIDSPAPSSSTGPAPYSRWRLVRKLLQYRRPREGLSEVDIMHRQYRLTVAIRHCLRYCLPTKAPRHQLKPTDYKEIFTSNASLPLDADGEFLLPKSRPATTTRLRSQEDAGEPNKARGRGRYLPSDAGSANANLQSFLDVRFKAFAPAVFASMRAAMGISHEEYLSSISPLENYLPYLQYVTNSKSKYSFFFTYDRRFILKMESAKSVSFFLSFLEDYIGHFISSPHSLIVKILGVYFVGLGRDGGGDHATFIVMQSVFWPSSRIAEKFDLKGCIAGRRETRSSEGGAAGPDDEQQVVLKDANFEERGIILNLGPNRGWFVEQISRDIKFLRSQGIVDYSLLVGIQPRRTEWSGPQNLAQLVSSIKRSSLGFTGDLSGWKQDEDETVLAEEKVSSNPNPNTSADLRPPESRLSHISYIADLLEDEPAVAAALKSSEAHQNTVHVRQVRFGGVKRSGDGDDDRRFLRADGGGVDDYEEIALSPTPSVHFQVHHPPPDQDEVKVSSAKDGKRRSSSTLNLKAAMNYILRQSSSGANPNQVAPLSSPPPPRYPRPRPDPLPPEAAASAARLSVQTPISPIPLTPLIDEQLAEDGDDDDDRSSGAVHRPQFDDNLPDLIKAANESAMLQLQATQEDQLRSHEKAKPSPTKTQKKNYPTDADAIELAPEHTTFSYLKQQPFSLYQWLKYSGGTSGGGRANKTTRAAENRRLLPDVTNAVHIVDGPGNRYYLGFVDIFTTYGFRQKLGHCFKTLKFCGNHHSSANAEVYSERLQEFLEDHLP